MADLDEEDGEKLAHPGTLVISEGKVADKSPADEPRGEWTYKLDPARKPKAIELIIEVGPTTPKSIDPRLLRSIRPKRALEHRLRRQALGDAHDQASAELAVNREVEAGIGQLQPGDVLPVDAATDHVGGLAIGEALGEL